MAHRNGGIVASGLVLLTLLGACGRSETTQPETSDTVGVTVSQARVETLREVVSASGTVVPSAAGEWTIYPQDSARVVELPKKEGDAVQAGDLLVRFEIASLAQDLAARQLEMMEATSRFERATAEATRLKPLFDRGLVSRQVYEASEAEAATARSLMNQVTTRQELATSEAQRSVVQARFPGIVLKVWVKPGDLVRGGSSDPVIQVIDPTRLQVAMQLPIAQLARIVPGQAATVRAIAGAEDLAATVAMKPVTTDANAPTGEVRLSFAVSSTLTLNAPVSAEILLDQRTNALVVPADAIGRDDISPFVMIAGDDQRAHRRDVEVGLTANGLTQITSGVQAGERVITGGRSDVSEGTPIAFTAR